jgi:hypothetical protein
MNLACTMADMKILPQLYLWTVAFWSLNPALAEAGVKRVGVDIAVNTRVFLESLSDGHSVMVIFEPAPEDLALQIETQLEVDLDGRVEPIEGDREGLYLLHHRVVTRSRLIRTPTLVEIELVYEDFLPSLRKHLAKSPPRNLPSSFVAPRFFQAEVSIRKGNFDRASEQLRELMTEKALAGWAALRLADIVGLTRRMSFACESYADVMNRFSTRTSGLMARLRMYVVRCPGATRDFLELTALMRRLRRIDGPVGRFLWNETLWAFGLRSDIKDGDFVMRHMSVSGHSRQTQKSRHAILARLIRTAQDPVEIARHALAYIKDLKSHPESKALAFAGMRALMELDLPERVPVLWNKVRNNRGNGAQWAKRQGEREVLAILIEGAKIMGNDSVAGKLSAQYRRRFKSSPPVTATSVSKLTTQDLETHKGLVLLEYRVRALGNAVAAKRREDRQKRMPKGDVK